MVVLNFKTMKHCSIALLVIILAFGCKSSKQVINNKDLKFVIPENCNRIHGKAQSCCGKIYVYSDGQLKSQILIKSNYRFGFTGAILISFFDKNDLLIYQTYTSSYGVNQNDSRLVNWLGEIPKWVVLNAESGSAFGIKTFGRLHSHTTDIGIKYRNIWVNSLESKRNE